MADSRRPLGRILTFYSYKGGTGRSMALANVAWILASSGRSVLMIDWDLEAPGLHRYFRPFLLDEELTASDGLIDLVDRYANAAIAPLDGNAPPPKPDWYVDYADFSDYVLSIDYDYFGQSGRLDFLPAGRQGDAYALKVSSFNWQNLYDRLGGGAFFEAFKRKAREEYDYVLIDSRTGVSDTAGICSVQMPDTLVVCFTYNNQSVKGAAGVAQWARARREQALQESRARTAGAGAAASGAIEDSPRPYRIFPIPMRVDAGESDRLAQRQAFARAAFRPLTAHLGVDLADYWSQVEVPHNVFYAYEEVLAAFKDNAGDPKTVLSAFVRMVTYVTDRDVSDYRLTINPEERQRFLEAFAVTALPAARPAAAGAPVETEEEMLVRTAEAALRSLTDDQKVTAQRIVGRLVRLGRDEEGGGLFPIRASIADFSDADRAVIALLEKQGVLSVVTYSPFSQQVDRGASDQTVTIADERLLKLSKTLIGWLERDREFLLWRQQLRTYVADWERSGHDDTALLGGRLLAEATMWRQRRKEELNPAEIAYLDDSARHAARAAQEYEARAAAQRAKESEAREAALRAQEYEARAAEQRAQESEARAAALRAREYEARAAAQRAQESEVRAALQRAPSDSDTVVLDQLALADDIEARDRDVFGPRRLSRRAVQPSAGRVVRTNFPRWLGLGAAAALAAAVGVGVWFSGARSGPAAIQSGRNLRDAVIVAAATAATDPLQRALLLLELGPDADAPANAKDLAIDLATTSLPYAVFQNESHPITVGRFGMDGNSFATGSSDGTVKVWAGGRTPVTIQSKVGGSVSVAIEPKLRRLLVTGRNHIAEVWDLDTLQEVKRLPIVSDLLDGAFVDGFPVVVQAKGSGREAMPFVAQFTGQRADEFNLADFKPVVTLPRGSIAVRFSTTGEWCVAATSTSLDVWQLSRGGRQRSFDIASPPRSLVLSPNGAYLAFATDEGASVVSLSGSDAPARSKPPATERVPAPRPPVRRLSPMAQATPAAVTERPIAVSPDGQVVVFALADGTVVPVAVSGGKASVPSSQQGGGRTWFRGHQGSIVDGDFGIDGALISTSGADGTSRLWRNPIGRTAPVRPSSSSSWAELWKTLRDQTTACLTASERVRLLSDPEAAAGEAAARCETTYGVRAFAPPPQTS